MPIKNPQNNIISFIQDPLTASIGSDEDKIYFLGESIPSLVASIAIEMAGKNYQCEPWCLGYRDAKTNLESGNIIIEYKGMEGWVVQYWPEGEEGRLLGASHVSHPEAALVVLALMITNPDRYATEEGEGHQDRIEIEKTE